MILGIFIGIVIGVFGSILVDFVIAKLNPSVSMWQTARNIPNTTPMLKIEARQVSKRVIQWKYINAEAGTLVEKSHLYVAWWPLSIKQASDRLNKKFDETIAMLEKTYPKTAKGSETKFEEE